MPGDDRAAKRVALVREILIGAGGASLDNAGVAILDGVRSVVKAALAPITARLSTRLGAPDVTASKELAARAAQEFQRDQLLQDAFRSELVRATEEVLQQGPTSAARSRSSAISSPTTRAGWTRSPVTCTRSR